jgi:hypothetical protein
LKAAGTSGARLWEEGMTKRDRLRHEARKQRLQEESIIDHLVRNFSGPRTVADGEPAERRRADSVGFIYGQVARRWNSSQGGLPTF